MCFDLFHTLVDVGRVPEQVGRFTADILGIDRQQWQAACFSPEHVIWEPADAYQTLLRLAHSIDPTIPHERVRQAVVERQARFDFALCEVGEEILAPLRELRRRGIRLGLISNASSSEVQAWNNSPLSALFDTVHFSCYCGYVKPDAPIYTEALAALEVAAADCLFVGDGGSDEHFGAHAVGMQPILITHFLPAGEQARRCRKYQEVLTGIVSDVRELEQQWC